MTEKEWLGTLSLAVGLFANTLYLWSILKKHSKPHAFSWVIWGLLTGIAFFAQIAKGAGPGSWATGFTAVSCLAVAWWAWAEGERDVTRSDWVTFLCALMTLPLWYATKDPFYAILLIVVIDALGYWPTFRKSWFRPGEEMISTYILGNIKFLLAILAMEHYSAVTTLYPLFIVSINTIFVVMVTYRRRVLKCVIESSLLDSDNSGRINEE